MHLCALARCTCSQPRQRIARAAPHACERAVARAILETDEAKAVVQRAHVRGVRTQMAARRREIGALPAVARTDERAGAVRLHVREGCGIATAHIEASVSHRAVDEQASRLDSERLQKEYSMQRRSRCRPRSAPHLEVG